jgi:hypothetical protein
MVAGSRAGPLPAGTEGRLARFTELAATSIANAGRYLDDPDFDPFWERAEALNTPIYLHASDAPELPSSLRGRRSW